MQVAKDMTKNNVHVDGFKWAMRDDGIEVVDVFLKLFFNMFHKTILKSMVDLDMPMPKFGNYTMFFF
jgi:hypothetical protein